MCTGIPVFTDNGLIFARTMEFTEKMNSSLYVVPKGQNLKATYTEPPQKTGQESTVFNCMEWQVDYAFVGPNYLNSDQVIEGFNETGLSVAGFYFPGFEQDYQAFPSQDADSHNFEAECGNTITQLSFASWALSQCNSALDVVEKVNSVRVCGSYFEELGKVPGIHWIVQDNQGYCFVFEFINNKLNIHENPYGVITNSPDFDWHKTNMANYMNLKPQNADSYLPRKPDGKKAGEDFLVSALGQGSGMLGLPGDFTSPSRFVRAVALSQAVDRVKDNNTGVNLCWNLINNVDIAIGTVKFSEGEAKALLEESPEKVENVDYTQWVSVSDLSELRYYYRTYENQNIRVVSLPDVLSQADLMKDKAEDPAPIMVISMINPEVSFQNTSNSAKAL